MANKDLISTSDEVLSALKTNQAVVALESTVIAHGLPRPKNYETAMRLENIVRDRGATPATVAILSGRMSAGLTAKEIGYIAETDQIRKASIRDLPIALAQRWDAATTVASTGWIAHRAGIKVFATGGIGGVHRGSLPDVSGDLPALASTPIVVVCSGAKIVLDLPATREWLETNGITVVGYQCDELPAFYSRTSGLPVDVRVDSALEIAAIYQAQRDLKMECALLVTVPVPAEFEIPFADLERSLNTSLRDAERRAIGGRELTPFLLSAMALASDGATLRTNIALLENNVTVAAEIALALTSI